MENVSGSGVETEKELEEKKNKEESGEDGMGRKGRR